MEINGANIADMFKGFTAKFNEFHEATPSHWQKLAMEQKSTGSEEVYGWLSDMPQMREWLGDRVIKQLGQSSYVIKNRLFEATITVPRTDVEDDKFGVYTPKLRMMAQNAAVHPDEMVFELLQKGFQTPCHDNQFFFDTDHPWVDENGQVQSVSNMQDGAGEPWFLLDVSRPIKPMVFQKRIDYTPQHLVQDNDPHVFMKDEYLYGMRARVNAGFGLWQFAFGSKAPLTPANYAAARAAMQVRRYDGGRIIGVVPTLLAVGPVHESAARKLLKNEQVEGSDNEWAGSAELLVTPYLAA